MATVAGIPDTRQARGRKSLYDRDYYTWARQQVEALRRRDFGAVDWEKVTEEMEALVRGEESTLRSQYTRIIEHMLKLQYRQATEIDPVAGWEDSVDNARSEIDELLGDSPGLKDKRDQLFHEAWPRARSRAIKAHVNHATATIRNDSLRRRERKRLTREWSRALPGESPYTRQQVEDSNWLPQRLRLANRPQSRPQPTSDS